MLVIKLLICTIDMPMKCMPSGEKDDDMVCVVVSTEELRMGKKHTFETVLEEISKFPTSVGAFVISHLASFMLYLMMSGLVSRNSGFQRSKVRSEVSFPPSISQYRVVHRE